MKIKCFLKSALAMMLMITLSNSDDLIGQSITERLGGLQLNILITTSDSIALSKGDQYILRRATGQSFTGAYLDEIYGYGYGYEAYHLEFNSDKKINSRAETGKREKVYNMRFYNSEGNIIANVDLDKNHVSYISNKHGKIRRTYSINLISIPLIILNETATIDLTFVKRR